MKSTRYCSSTADRVEFPDTYVETYLTEDIWQEALVRSLDRFHRFRSVAALVNGQVLNLSNVARDVGAARSRVQGCFSILEDTLLGWQLPAWRKRAKVKEIAHPKFYLFDCGVQRALAGLHRDKPSSTERGTRFETWLLNEFRALSAWSSQGAEFFHGANGDSPTAGGLFLRRRRRAALGQAIGMAPNSAWSPITKAPTKQLRSPKRTRIGPA